MQKASFSENIIICGYITIFRKIFNKRFCYFAKGSYECFDML